MRFLSLASVVGADQTALRPAASAVVRTGDRGDGSGVEASCAATLTSISPTRVSALFHRSPVLLRQAGSADRWRHTAGMPGRRGSELPQVRAPAHREPDRGDWPLVLRPRRPPRSLTALRLAEALVQWRHRRAVLRMRCSAAHHCRVDPASRNSAECYVGFRCSGSSVASAATAADPIVAVLECAVMLACRHVVAHHFADCLRPFPTHVTFMDARDQRQPLG